MTEHILPELTTRQEEILTLVVRSYTRSPEPVSSKHLVETYNLNFSSATVRNEMARLEEMGLITAPHTSAGRIPTALGYRYYVMCELMTRNALSEIDHQYIENKFNQLPAILEQWMRQAATVLARIANSAALVTPPIGQAHKFKHVELISIQGRLTLMILVAQGGTVHQRMLTLAELVPQHTLSETADRINSLCHSMSAAQMRVKSHQLDELGREIIEIAADLLERSGTNPARALYRDGLSDVINAFPDTVGAQQAIRVFEERAFLDVILTDILHPLLDAEEVQVVIGGDGREEISHLSLVLSRYGVREQLSGTVGILGPMNLNYGRAISAVRKVSRLMTVMLNDLYDETGDDTSQDWETDPEA